MDKQTPVDQLTLAAAKQEIAPLREQLIKWGQEYYEQDNPSVEDYVYDRAYQRLVELEQRFPELKTSDSPTQHVGGGPTSELTKVTHEIPMLSMGDVFSIDELMDFNQRQQDNAADNVEVQVDEGGALAVLGGAADGQQRGEGRADVGAQHDGDGRAEGDEAGAGQRLQDTHRG